MAEMTGARVLAEMIDGYGVEHVFMVPAVMRRMLAEMEHRTAIKRIAAHSEKSAAYMADGYARAGCRPAICMAQAVGAFNLAAGLRDAYLAHQPVIAFTGGKTPRFKHRRVYQEADDVPAFEPVTKLNATIDDVARFPDMLRQAFRVATTGMPGPVHLQFQGNEGQIESESADMEPVVDPAHRRLPPHRPDPSDNSVAALLRRIDAAERPIIVAGGGVRMSGANAELVAFAEKTGIPVATSLNGKAVIPGNHPLSVGVAGTYSRISANRAVLDADLVIFIGTEAGGMTTHFWQVPKPGTAAVQVDINPESLGFNYPVDAAVLGDAKLALAKMTAMTDGAGREKRRDWTARAEGFVQAYRQEFADLMNSDQAPIRPERMAKELTDQMPDDALIVVDTGHSGMWMGGMFDLTHPSQDYIRCAGHLGWAFSAAIGAKCAVPERPVFAFTGDMGFWYHIAEIETAVRWGINTVTLVNNNSAGSQNQAGFDRAYDQKRTEKSLELWHFKETDFAAIANQIGALGIRVEKPGDLPGAIQQAFGADRPVILDVVGDIEAMAPLAYTGG